MGGAASRPENPKTNHSRQAQSLHRRKLLKNAHGISSWEPLRNTVVPKA